MRRISLALFAVLLPTAAAAQNSGFFIQAGPVLDVVQESSFDAGPVFSVASFLPITGGMTGGLISGPPSDEQSQSTKGRFAPGGSIALGVFLSPSVSLRLETSIHGTHVSSEETSSASEGTRSFTRNTTGTTDIAIAAGWHQGTGRTSISYLAGVLFRRSHNDAFASFTYPIVTVRTVGGRLVQIVESETQEENYTTTLYDTGVMAGLDVTVNLTDHLAVVPHVRLTGSSYAWNIRPGVALRWRR